jgi:glycyl-tRNA synthetase
MKQHGNDAGDLMALCRRRGFVWPSFELYGGVAGMFDYGPTGFSLRNNIVEVWRDVYKRGEGFIEIDSETVNPQEVFRASGHVDQFTDLMTYCTSCRSPFRADHLVGDVFDNPDVLTPAELDAAFAEHGIVCPECGGKLGGVEEFNLMFRTTIGPGSSRVGYLRPETAQGIFVNFLNLYRYNRDKLPLGVIQTGRGYRNEIAPRQGMIRMREFNMMEVELFVDPDDKDWVRYPAVKDEEITLVPNNTGEPTVMTLERAVEDGIIANRVLAYFIHLTRVLLVRLGVDPERLRFRQHLEDEMAHYAADCWDAEALLSYGWTEITGVADRGCWDLSRHAEFSGTDLSHFRMFDEPQETEVERIRANHRELGPRYKARAKRIASLIESADPSEVAGGRLTIAVDGAEMEIDDSLFEIVTVREKVSGERTVPHVIEPSYGLDRIFYTVLEHAYEYDVDKDYAVLRLKPEVAPVKVGVFPLMERDGMDTVAQELHKRIHSHRVEAYYDGSGTIGRRYARMDEIGTPWCITVDYETLEGELAGTVTIRDRDTSEQKRIPIDDCGRIVGELLDGRPFSSL